MVGSTDGQVRCFPDRWAEHAARWRRRRSSGGGSDGRRQRDMIVGHVHISGAEQSCKALETILPLGLLLLTSKAGQLIFLFTLRLYIFTSAHL